MTHVWRPHRRHHRCRSAGAPSFAREGNTAGVIGRRERRGDLHPLLLGSPLRGIHAHPTASDGDLLELALEALLERTARRKGIGTRRLKTPRPSRREHIAAHVFAAALERAGGCCEWKLASGRVCGSRRKLQGDHIQPLALGGTSDLDNVRILCAFHNLLAARELFGDDWIAFARNPRAAIARRAGMGNDASTPRRAIALG